VEGTVEPKMGGNLNSRTQRGTLQLVTELLAEKEQRDNYRGAQGPAPTHIGSGESEDLGKEGQG